MKKIKSGIRYLTLVVALAGAIFGLYKQVSLWQAERVLGTQDSRGFEQALVSRVVDGDIVELSDGRKVRYIGMDTPETKHPVKGVECFGKEASQRNTELVSGKVVQLEKDVSETDRYGRLLRYVWLDSEMVNKMLVSEGFAFARTYPPDVKNQTIFKVAEQEAREQQKGLWSSCELNNPTQIQSLIELTDAKVLGATDATEQTTLQPEGCVIKGNISANGKLYHLPGCSSYGATTINEAQGEKWFCSEAEAQTAGWSKSKSCNY